jgi:hypothetical protein
VRVVFLRSVVAAMALSTAAPALAESATATEPPAKVFRGEEIAILLLGIAGVMIGHLGSRTRKRGDDPKA